MADALATLSTSALFSLVTIASAMMRHEMLIFACIPSVFVGFIMAIYSGETFGLVPTGSALVGGAPSGWWLAPAEASGSFARDLAGVGHRPGSGAYRGKASYTPTPRESELPLAKRVELEAKWLSGW